jgi:tRNA (guanosine-2'-O-)-methyltransferase
MTTSTELDTDKEFVYENKSNRGFFGVAVIGPRFEANIGILARTANVFGAAFVATIGERYNRPRTDTGHIARHKPVFHYQTFEDFYVHLPQKTDLVGIELDQDAKPIEKVTWTPRPIFLFGAEDYGIPKKYLNMCRYKVKLPGTISMNLSACASIIMYDYWSKLQNK